jgi:peptidoglycan/LPS O-acetylase OafA/YrhL
MAREIRTFTGIRGVAASLVAIYHFTKFKPIAPFIPFELSSAYMSVDAFFILSGYVLAYSYSINFQNGVQLNEYAQFIYRRFCRIYPAYFFIMLLYLIKLIINVSGDGSIQRFTATDFLSNYLMLNTWAINARPIIGPSWSVCVEVFCYLLFPALVLLFCRNIVSAAIALVTGLAGIFLIAKLGIGVEGQLDVVFGDTYYPTLRAFCGFVIGMAFYQIAPALPRSPQRWNIVFVGSLLLIALSVYERLGDWLTYTGIAVLILSSSYEGSISKALFDNPVTYFLGKISYSLYLIHTLLITLFPKIVRIAENKLPFGIGILVVLALYFGLTLALATISHELFEVRAQNALRRLLPSRQPIQASA